MQKRSLGLFALAAVFTAACSSTPTNPTDAGPDTGVTDSGTPKKDGGADSGTPPPDISGTTDMNVHVQEFVFGAAPKDLAGCEVRVENGQGGFVDGTTGADGIAHIKVDATKGPFDITAAKVGYVALSVLNQAGPLATNMIVSPADSSALFSSYTVSGQITNKKNAGDTVQADLYAFQTVLTKPADTTYSTKFSYFNTTTNPAMNITALELDAQENIVNAYQAPMTARTKGNMTVDIAFPAQSPAVSIANVKVNFPSAGILKGSDVTQIGNPVSDVHAGNAVVVKDFGQTASMFVGVGNATLPQANVSSVKIQSVSGANFAPDHYELFYQTADLNLSVRSYTITDGAMFPVGQVDALDGGGTTLDDVTFGTNGTNYDASGFVLVYQNNQGGNSTAWSILAAGSKLAAHHIPHLPAKVKVGDLTGGSAISASGAFLSKYQGGTAAPWSESNKPVEVQVTRPVGSLDQGSRP